MDGSCQSLRRAPLEREAASRALAREWGSASLPVVECAWGSAWHCRRAWAMGLAREWGYR